MKILAFSPFDPAVHGGNTATLKRLQRGLAARRHTLELRAVDDRDSLDSLRAHVQSARPDLLHFYHAWRTGRFLPGLAGLPSVLTLSGTDLNEDWKDPARRAAIEAAVARAGAVVTYNPGLARRIPRARVLAKGVEWGDAPFDLRRAAGLAAADLVFLQAGSIRPVKNNLFAIDALRNASTALRLIFLGPILDAGYGRTFEQAIKAAPWARRLPAVAPAAMAAAYAAADVVLNTSLSEGLSNALMEAMAAGRAVLASDVEGNRDLLQDGCTGLLYRDAEDLRKKALLLAGSPGRRAELGAAARIHAEATFSIEKEIDGLLDAYAEATARI